MAIAPLQLPGPIQNAPVNWSGLDKIGDAYADYKQRNQIGEAVAAATGPDGKVDANMVGTSLARLGLTKEALPFTQLGQTAQFHQDTVAQQQAQLAEMSRAHRATEGQASAQLGLQRDQFGLAQQKETREANAPMAVAPGTELINKGTGQRLYSNDSSQLDPETLTQLGEQLRKGDTSVLMNMGRGAQGAQNILAIRKEATRLNALEGRGGADQAAANAGYKADTAGMRANATRVAGVEYAANTVDRAINIAEDAYSKLPRTQFQPANKLIELWQTNTGSPEQVAAGFAVNTLANEYARVVSPTGVPTEGTRQKAYGLINTIGSPEQFKAITGMMRKEIASSKAAGVDTRQELGGRISGKPQEAVKSETAPTQKVGSYADVNQSLSNAKDAIAKGAVTREQAIKKLIDGGVPPEMANRL